MHIHKLILLVLLVAVPTVIFSANAIAGVVTPAGLPSLNLGAPQQGPAKSDTAPTKSADQQATKHHVVPGIHGKQLPPPPTPAEIFQHAITTPPEGPESQRVHQLAEDALAASQQSKVNIPMLPEHNGGIATTSAGESVLVCAPLHTCVIALPDGVKPVTTVGVSPAEWQVQQAMVGKQPEIFLSPKFKGLHQNIVIAATDHKKAVNYQVHLVSDANRYIPILKIQGIAGPVTRAWSPAEKAMIRGHSPMMTGTSPISRPVQASSQVLPLPRVPIEKIQTDWSIHCGGGGWFSESSCTPIRPLRVYDDGTHTFIDMPKGLSSHGGYPIVQGFNRSGKEIGIDTEIRNRQIVVNSVPASIKLRLGTQVVDIKRKKENVGA
ncbi:TrbG/VirB9 family P-type conjugative transfer protein [Acidithiobacillus albertensis]|uniref:TrbG/VirB9 family P-type conjugative transfer protein n=1 Tax=Acidithiobacillus albertensis TaxID=119978 RepID=UPI00094ACC50|nr:TrbG/VirB9 family P-type conjugative transfer protein [Acidithiobacillus albertensis]